jgi:hypothetical protein
MFCEYNWCVARRIFTERNLILGIPYIVVNCQKYSSCLCVSLSE